MVELSGPLLHEYHQNWGTRYAPFEEPHCNFPSNIFII